jgi:hypothetical protein
VTFFPVARRGPLTDAIQQLPPSTRAFIREGLGLLAKHPPVSPEALFEAAVATSDSTLTPDHETLASTLGTPKPDVMTLVGAAAFLLTVMTDRGESAEEVVSAIRTAKLLESEGDDPFIGFCKFVEKRRADLSLHRRRADLAQAVLPSLARVAIATDLRADFTERARSPLVVPVVVVHLATDAYGSNFWFQMTREEAEDLLRRLDREVQNLKKAEEWLSDKDQGA